MLWELQYLSQNKDISILYILSPSKKKKKKKPYPQKKKTEKKKEYQIIAHCKILFFKLKYKEYFYSSTLNTQKSV